jgi:hypothetical protein
VVAKTGTSVRPDPVTGSALFNVQALPGFMETDNGRTLVFNISMSSDTYGDTYDDLLTGLVEATPRSLGSRPRLSRLFLGEGTPAPRTRRRPGAG